MRKSARKSGRQWVKLNKDIVEWELFAKPECVQVFIWLLVNAAPEDGKFNGIELTKGTLYIRIKKLARDLNLTYQNMRTIFKNLAECEAINFVSHKGAGTAIEIVNYNYYDEDF